MFQEYTLGKNYSRDSKRGVGSIVQRLGRDFPETNTGAITLKSEDSLRFKSDLFFDIIGGSHSWTVRYKPNTIRWPYNDQSTRKNRLDALFPDESENWLHFGSILVPNMAVGLVCDWPERHPSITGSGWESKEHMVEGISDIYEPIYGKRLASDDILVAYALRSFKFVSKELSDAINAELFGEL